MHVARAVRPGRLGSERRRPPAHDCENPLGCLQVRLYLSERFPVAMPCSYSCIFWLASRAQPD